MLLVWSEDKVPWNGPMTDGICGSPNTHVLSHAHRFKFDCWISIIILALNGWFVQQIFWKFFNKTKWASYGGHGNMASDNPQLMSNGSMLVIGQKVKFYKSKI